jgi:hypothetical protein
MRKIVLTFGLIAGAILSAMMLIALAFQDQIGFERGAIVGYTSMVLAFLMVFFGVRSYRDNVAGGSIGFGRAFMVGLAITAIACVCYVATWEFVYYVLAPDFLDKYVAYALEQARASGASEAQLAAQMKEMAEFKVMYQNPLFNIAITLIEPLPVGLVFTLVTAGILGRRRRGAGAPAQA